MANNFSTLKNSQTSQKFYLVRLQPTRYLNDLLADQGGGEYTYTFNKPIANVKENGSELTLVTASPSAGEYTYNESTGLLTVVPNSAPASDNIITLDFYLFYTGERNRVWYEDPENTSTTLRDWEPRIRTSPSFNSSVDQITEGILEVSLSNLVLINNQNEFQQNLTVNDSFNKKPAIVWLCLNELENIQRIYSGRINKISLTEENITLGFDDPLSSLLEPAFMGDDTRLYVTDDEFTAISSTDSGKPIPYIFGTVSRYSTDPEDVTNLGDASKLAPQSMHQAFNINFDTDIDTANNREWGLCRVGSDGFADISFTPSNIDNSDGNFTRLDTDASTIEKYFVGDTMVVNDSGTDRYVRVYYVDRTNNYIYTTKESNLTTGDNVLSNICPSIVVWEDETTAFYPIYGRDYTATTETLASGNLFLKITFDSSMESNVGMSTLDPGLHRVAFRVHPDITNMKHGSVLKTILESAGITVNSTSITDANTALDVIANFSVPNFDEQDFSEYVKYAQDLLKSSFGYITQNNDFEIEYKLFDTPSSTNEVSDTDIAKDSYRVDIQYKDIVTEIIAFNFHYFADEVKEDTNDTPSKTLSNDKAIYLHGINKTVRLRHVLESINSRLQVILNYRTERKATYNFDTKIFNIDNIIGDDIELVTDSILGGEASRDLKIVSISKNPKNTNIIASDLYNI